MTKGHLGHLGRIEAGWVDLEARFVCLRDLVKIGGIVGTVVAIEHVNANEPGRKHYIFSITTDDGRRCVEAVPGQTVKIWQGTRA